MDTAFVTKWRNNYLWQHLRVTSSDVCVNRKQLCERHFGNMTSSSLSPISIGIQRITLPLTTNLSCKQYFSRNGQLSTSLWKIFWKHYIVIENGDPYNQKGFCGFSFRPYKIFCQRFSVIAPDFPRSDQLFFCIEKIHQSYIFRIMWNIFKKAVTNHICTR